jgi:hypothetical protein
MSYNNYYHRRRRRQHGGMTSALATMPMANVSMGLGANFTGTGSATPLGSTINGLQMFMDPLSIPNPWAQSAPASEIFANSPALAQVSSLLPNPTNVTFFNISASPQIDNAVSIAENTIQNVGSADPVTVVEQSENVTEALSETPNPTLTDLIGVKNVIDKATAVVEDLPTEQAAQVSEVIAENLNAPFASREEAYSAIRQFDAAGEPTDLYERLARAIAGHHLELRVRATFAIANGNIDFTPQIDQVRNEIQRTGTMNSTALKSISEMSNELEVLGIVDPKLQWASAATFWMKEQAKSILDKGGDHISNFFRYTNKFGVPAIRSAQQSFVNLKESANSLYAAYTQQSAIERGQFTVPIDDGWYNSINGRKNLSSLHQPRSDDKSGFTFTEFLQSGSNVTWEWANEQFTNGNEWAQMIYATNSVAFEFALITHLLPKIIFSSVFVGKYLLKKFNVSIKNVLYARFKERKNGVPQMQVLLDDGTAVTSDIEDPDILLRTAADESAITFVEEPPLNKGEEKAAILASTSGPIVDEMLSNINPGAAQVVSEMQDNPELANKVLDQIDNVPNGTTVPIVLDNGATANVDVKEVKNAVNSVVNLHVADQVLGADPETVNAVVSNLPADTAKAVVAIVEHGDPKVIVNALKKPENTIQDTAIKKGLQEIATINVIPALAVKKEEKQDAIATSAPSAPSVPPPPPPIPPVMSFAQPSRPPPPPPPFPPTPMVTPSPSVIPALSLYSPPLVQTFGRQRKTPRRSPRRKYSLRKRRTPARRRSSSQRRRTPVRRRRRSSSVRRRKTPRRR